MERTPNVLGLALAALAGAVAVGALGNRGEGARPDAAPRAVEPAAAALAPALTLSQTFKAACRKVQPSVLSITTERWGDFHNNSLVRMMEHLFRRSASPQLERSIGTGFVIDVVDGAGIALTNDHVVSGAKRVRARLHDGAEVDAEVVGTDAASDLAVLRLEPRPDGKPYVPVEPGDSDRLDVGDWVLSAGNPFGLDQTVTAGIVSAKGRSSVGVTAYEDFIQTDCAINPGNSGGPLLDLEGRVVGVTTAIATKDGEYSGVGFAIPMAMALKITAALRKGGRVSRGYLGVGTQKTSAELLKRLGHGERRGALLSRILPGSPAEKANLQPGDLVVAVDGRPVADGTQLMHVVAEKQVGRPARLSVVRGGQEHELTFVPGERPSGEAKREPKPAPKALGDAVGVTTRQLTPELAQLFGLEWDPKLPAVVVVKVDAYSLAAEYQLRPGMVLQQVEDVSVRTLADLELAKPRLDKRRGVLLRIWDGTSSSYVLLR